MLRWALDDSQKARLLSPLTAQGMDVAGRERWQVRHSCSHCSQPLEPAAYVRLLAYLALEEFGNPRFMSNSARRAERFGCSVQFWNRTHAPRYEALYGQLAKWLAGAARTIWRNQPWEEPN